MRFELTAYAYALWAAAAVSLTTAAAAWARRNGFPGSRYFVAMMGCILLWCLMAGMEAAAVGLPAKVLFSKLGYIGICGVAPLFLRFAAAYGGREKSIGSGPALLLWAVSAVTLGLVFSNGWHHLVWTDFTLGTLPGGNILVYGHGTWYWIWVAWYGFVTLFAMVILVQATLQCRTIYLRQTLVFLAGVAFPWIGEVLYLSGRSPFPGLDFPSIGFAAMGVIVLLGMRWFALFDIVPVARTILVDRMSEGIMVLDAKQRIVDVNPAARKLHGAEACRIGRPGAEAFTALKDILPRAGLSDGEYRADVLLPGSPSRCLDLVVTPLSARAGKCAGWMIVLRDISVRRRIEEERERLLQELQAALADVKTLRGLLPICASCNRIRDDSGYWENLENYIQQHSEAQFSHGLCDDCLEKLYDELSHCDRSRDS